MNARPEFGVYGYEFVGGIRVERLIRVFPTMTRAIKFAEPLSTTIVSAEVRRIVDETPEDGTP